MNNDFVQYDPADDFTDEELMMTEDELNRAPQSETGVWMHWQPRPAPTLTEVTIREIASRTPRTVVEQMAKQFPEIMIVVAAPYLGTVSYAKDRHPTKEEEEWFLLVLDECYGSI